MDIIQARRNYFRYFQRKTDSSKEHRLFVSDVHVDFQIKRGFGWPVPFVQDEVLDILVKWLEKTDNAHLIEEAKRTFPR